MAKLDLNKINSGLAAAKQTEPRKIFSTLKREPRFKRPSDEQGEVLDAWFAERTRSDNTIKMNTGGGKTIVGLLCLQSSLNEGTFPAIYIVPDNYLLRQVVAEAKALGISTTEDEQSTSFLSGKSILVANVWKLFNGRSVFGVANEGTKINIGAIVIDDAHACLSTVADQFRIKLDSQHKAYKPLLELFEDDLKAQSESLYLDVTTEDPGAVMQVPFWSWKSKKSKVLEILHPYRKDEGLKWSWPLVKDVLHLSQATFGQGSLEIAPRFMPIDVISAFANAKRRIYMTATLADDGVLVSHFQADPDCIKKPIQPKGGGDIGDRMILSPQEINPEITIDEVKALAKKKSASINVSVIVPSKERSKYWSDVADQVLTAENIEVGTEKLRSGHVGLTVFINKYDGIDLPKKACELLVLDGLPEFIGLTERVEQLALDGTRRQLVRQIQRIEQGMGRGVRSSEDHCVVLLVGSRLTQRLYNPESRALFSSSTRAQLDLGREVTDQIKGESLEEIEKIMDLCLGGDTDWVNTSRSAVVNAEEPGEGHVDAEVVLLRNAFDAARSSRFDRAQEYTQTAVKNAKEKRAKGYLKQQLAEYLQHTDPAKAQEVQLSAVDLNNRLIRPIGGITYSKLSPPHNSQAAGATAFMKRFLEKNDLILWVNALLDDLAWGEENSKSFERAMQELGLFLGFGSQRPEEEYGRGPDNLWSLGELSYLVIECKSGAVKAASINKHDCNQLTGSMVWFAKQYDSTCNASPVMVHPKVKPEYAATLPPDTRIITVEKLASLKDSVRNYTIAVSSDANFSDATKVKQQLAHFGLSRPEIVKQYSVKAM